MEEEAGPSPCALRARLRMTRKAKRTSRRLGFSGRWLVRRKGEVKDPTLKIEGSGTRKTERERRVPSRRGCDEKCRSLAALGMTHVFFPRTCKGVKLGAVTPAATPLPRLQQHQGRDPTADLLQFVGYFCQAGLGARCVFFSVVSAADRDGANHLIPYFDR